MSAYLFVHFKEKTMPDGEQVYFGLSRDGFHWESVNNGQPVLWAYYGDKGVRDHTIVRSRFDGRFHIFATDLSLAYGMRGKYQKSWENVSRMGSKCLAHWESDNLTNWTEQKLIQLGNEHFGCLWAPDIIYDPKQNDYVLHWSSSHASNGFGCKGIYYARTKDFRAFTDPKLLYQEEKYGVIDSAIYEENGVFYMFVKHERNPGHVILLRSNDVTGPYERMPEFDKEMNKLEEGVYEAPTAVQLKDGRWCLFLDYYGVPGAGQGYVPFIADHLESGRFVRSDEEFQFPYGFKHGTILPISDEEYRRISCYQWPQN